MIGYLKGKILAEDGDSITLLTESGVGYAVNIVTNTHHTLESNEQELPEAEYYIYTAVSETDISLWGFNTKEELALFKMLIGVSGVGNRTGQALIRALGGSQLVRAIAGGDAKGLKAPGVGQKTAERIIIDLQSKLKDSVLLNHFAAGGANISSDSKLMSDPLVGEAIAAALTLGYSEKDLMPIVGELVAEGSYETAQTLLKDILKHVR